jgi:hypothetical protein
MYESAQRLHCWINDLGFSGRETVEISRPVPEAISDVSLSTVPLEYVQWPHALAM